MNRRMMMSVTKKELQPIGVDLIDWSSLTVGYLDTANGNILSNTDFRITDFIPLFNGYSYTATKSQYNAFFCFYDENKNFLSGYSVAGGIRTYNFDTNGGQRKFVRYSFRNNATNVTLSRTG